MRDEFEKYLHNKYSTMFPEEQRQWGMGCGDGWFRIIDKLCANIKHHVEWKAKQNKPIPPVVVTQVKEKFGTLRFYYDGGDDYISGLVSMAEAMSESTCEECGDVGSRRGSGWIKTLCDKHAKDKDYLHEHYVDVGDTVSIFTENGYEPANVVNVLEDGQLEVLAKNNATLQVKPLVVGGVELKAYVV